MTVQSSDLVMGKNVKWYIGGVDTSETVTVTSGDVSSGYFDIAGTAEYGLVRATVNGAEKALVHYQAGGTTPATQASGSGGFTYSGITADDVVVLRYINIASTVMTQIMASQGGNVEFTGDKTSVSVDGQSTKVSAVSAAEGVITWNELEYNETMIAAFQGATLTSDVVGTKKTWSNAFTGFNSVGALVGIEYAANGTTIYRKYGLIGVTPTSVGVDLNTDTYYAKKYSAQVDVVIVFNNK